MSKIIGTMGTVDSLTIGGRVFTDLTNLITLTCNTNAASVRSTFRKCGSHVGAGYQVTAGKTLYIYALSLIPFGAGGSEAQLAQTDNDVGLQSNTAFGNPIYFGTESSTIGATGTVISRDGIGLIVEIAGAPLGAVAATKYVSADSLTTTGGAITIYGYEV